MANDAVPSAELMVRAVAVLRQRYPLHDGAWVTLEESFQALCGRKGPSPHAAFACFSLFLQHGHGQYSEIFDYSNHSRLLGRLAEVASIRSWGELGAELRKEPKERHESVLVKLLEREQSQEKARTDAIVSLNRMMASLEWALPNLVPLRRRAAIRAVAPTGKTIRGVEAYTDGRDIYLPSTVNTFPDRQHNELVYLRLLVHEALHLAEGTFATQACVDAHPRVVERLRARGLSNEDVGVLPARSLKSISKLFGDHQELFFSLLNCVEDTRIERSLSYRLPRFLPVVEYVDQALRALSTPTAFEPAAVQVLRAIQSALDGRPVTMLPRAYVSRFAPLRQQIREFGALDAPTLMHSILLATELCLWFVCNVPDEPRKTVLEALQTRRPLLTKQYEPYVDLAPPGFRGHKEFAPRMNLDHVSQLDSGGRVVPEYDFWQSIVRPEGASVLREPWDPLRVGVVGRAVRCEFAGSEKRSAPRAVFRSTGMRLDPKRFVRFSTARRAGGAVDSRIFHGRDVFRVDQQTTVVLDLSVSMMHFRPEGVRPLERAVGVVEDLAETMGDGAPLTVLGCIDGGPEKVRLMEIKGPHETLQRSTLETLHGFSMGGFRMGAILRYLALEATERQRVVLVTDTGSHYVTRGIRRVWDFDQALCADCPRANSLCDIERSFPDEVWIHHKASVFEPLEYEIADIRHAMETTADKLDVHVVLLTDYWGDDLCNHGFGIGRWSKI